MFTIKNIATTLTAGFMALASTQSFACHHDQSANKPIPAAFTKFDANQDQRLSKDEFNAYTAAKFLKMDSDQDGMISVEEYKSYSKNRKMKKCDKKCDKMKSSHKESSTFMEKIMDVE